MASLPSNSKRTLIGKTLAYYLVGFLDLLGQSKRLRELTSLPNSNSEKQHVARLLNETAGVVLAVREGFTGLFEAFEEPTGFLETLSPQMRSQVKAATRATVQHWGVSDSVVVGVPLLDEPDQHPCEHVSGIYRALVAANSMWLTTMSVGVPMRGAIEVGLAIPLTEDELYGPAVANAYFLESRVAQSPRIVVGGMCLRYLQQQEQGPTETPEQRLAVHLAAVCLSMLRRDADGIVALDPLGDFALGVCKRMAFLDGESHSILFDKAHRQVKAQLVIAEGRADETLVTRYRPLVGYFDKRATAWAAD